MIRERFAKICLSALAGAALLGAACDVDTSSFNPVKFKLQVYIDVLNDYDNLSAQYEATLTDPEDEVPSAYNGFDVSASGFLPPQNPTSTRIPFDLSSEQKLKPGIWTVTVTVREDDEIIILCSVKVRSPVRGATSASSEGILEVIAIEGRGETCSSDSSIEPPPPVNHDIAVTSINAPAQVERGEEANVVVTMVNQSNVQEDFSIGLTDTPSAGAAGSITPQSDPVDNLAVNASTTRTFVWNSAGAGIGPHVLEASVPPLENEVDTGNNTQPATVTVLRQQDVAVVSPLVVTSGAVIAGQPFSVDVTVRNNSDLEKSFAVILEDQPPGGGATVNLATSSTLLLGPDGSPTDRTTFSFSGSGLILSAPGQHNLTARIPVLLPDERDESNNTSDPLEVFVENHDVEAVPPLTAPTAADVGDPVTATVTVTNNGNIVETPVTVTLTAQRAGDAPIQIAPPDPVSVAAGATVAVDIPWDTACIPDGTYTLTANVFVPNDNDTGNDTTAPQSITLSVDHELSLEFVNPPTEAFRPTPSGGYEFRLRLKNNNSVEEIDVNVTRPLIDTATLIEAPPVVPPNPSPAGGFSGPGGLPTTLACGDTKEFYFFFAPNTIEIGLGLSVKHVLSATIENAIVGDDPADNTATVEVDFHDCPAGSPELCGTMR